MENIKEKPSNFVESRKGSLDYIAVLEDKIAKLTDLSKELQLENNELRAENVSLKKSNQQLTVSGSFAINTHPKFKSLSARICP